MTKLGIYVHHKGGRYRVLFTARVSTNGPDEGKSVVVYVSLTKGTLHVRDESQFHDELPALEGGVIQRFRLMQEIVDP